MKYTLGPWKGGHNEDATGDFYIDGPGKKSHVLSACTCCDGANLHAPDREQRAGDAALMIAAPMMYEALLLGCERAEAVAASWESGDLAGAVRELTAWAEEARGLLAPTPSPA